MRARPALVSVALACCGSLWIDAGSAAGQDAEAPRAAAGRIEGRVLDAEGWPLAGARVFVLRDPGDEADPASSRPLYETTSDGDGRFSIGAVEPGTYRIDIEAPRHQLAHVGVHLPPGTTPLTPLEVHLRLLTTSRLATTDPRGSAAPPLSPARAAGPAAQPASASHDRFPPGSSPDADPALAGARSTTDGSSSAGVSPAPSPPDLLPAVPPDGIHAAIREALEASQLPQARALLARVEGRRVEDADLFYAVGEALLRAGETEAAAETLDGAIARDPAFAEARYRHALALLGLGRRDEARDEFARVLELRPEGAMADGARQALDALAPGGSSR